MAEVGEFSFDILALLTSSKAAAGAFFWANSLKHITLIAGPVAFAGISLLVWPILYLARRTK